MAKAVSKLATESYINYGIRQTLQSHLLPESAAAFIDGKWTSAKKNHTFAVNNPADGQEIARAANCDVQDTNLAIKAAQKALKTWAFDMTAKERSSIMMNMYKLMTENTDELARILTIEQGKPLADARAEIQYSTGFFEWGAAEARRIHGEIIESPQRDRKIMHFKEPLGVVGIISPWNFPSAMITRKVGAALAAGCTCIVKPAEDTPLSALALATLAQKSGIPKGVLNVIPADRTNTEAIGQQLCSSTDVSAISFTGSTAVGKTLLHQSASTVKRVSLELGGNSSFIVFPSASIEKAIQGVMGSKFRCMGQACVATNRIFVHADIHDRFVVDLCNEMNSELILGNGMDSGVTQGPLINEKAVEKLEWLIDDAVKKGAQVLTGGGRNKTLGGTFFEPTLLVGVNGSMDIHHTEIFGPVACISEFTNEDDVITEANDTRYGLAGYVFTNDMSQMFRVSRKLEVGIIGANEGLLSCHEATFGGAKESGLGREGSHYGIDEFTHVKYMCLGGL